MCYNKRKKQGDFMKKLDEVRNVLQYYVLANKLQTTITDDQNNYSIADHLYGSMILAVAMNETDQLGKVFRMMILDDFQKLYPYRLYVLKSGNSFERELNEFHKLQTKEARLAFKYKLLDLSFAEAMLEGKELDDEQKINMARSILKDACDCSLEEMDEIYRFYALHAKLKHKVRTGWDQNHWNIKTKRLERVSEHVVKTMMLALLMESEFQYPLDMDRILQMLIIHETGETLIGDITPFDGVTDEQKKEIEHQAMTKAVGRLSYRDALLDMLFEFDEGKTDEARFAYFCDKLDADLQAKIYQDQKLQHSLNDQSDNVVFANEKAQKIKENGASTAFDIWYAFDHEIYKDDQKFPEFSMLFKMARDNNLFHLHEGVLKEKVELTEKEHESLTNLITSEVNALYEDDNVDCVYMTSEREEQKEKGSIRVTVLLKNNVLHFPYREMIDRINCTMDKKNSTEIDVYFKYGHVQDNLIVAFKPQDTIRIERLAVSDILFDKSGETTRIQNCVKNQSNLNQHYLVDYVPPISETTKRKLKMKI